jgi:hypothetical protein
MHDHTECIVATDTETQREDDPLLHHLNDRPCVMGGGGEARTKKPDWRRECYTAGVLADSMSVAVIRLDK